MVELPLLLLLGMALGVVTGLIPGIHPNLLASLALVFSLTEPLTTSLVLVSAAVANSFVSFIPSVFLGAPDAGTELSVLPGHRMLMEGKGYEAVRLTVVGGLLSVVFVLLTLPLLTRTLPVAYSILRPHLHIILASVLVYSFWIDRSLWPLVVVALSGVLGLVVLDSFRRPIFPMLTGLFATSTLLYSLKTGTTLPSQSPTFREMAITDYANGLYGYVAGLLVGVLPGLGVSQAAYLVQEGSTGGDRGFLVAIGGVTTSDAIFSLLALWLIGNPRSGVAVAVGNLMGDVRMGEVMVLVGAVTVSAAVVSIVTLKIADEGLGYVERLDYRRLTWATVGLLAMMTFLLSGLEGLVILSVSTSVGLVAVASGIRRSYCMGCLLVPAIFFFAGV